jgi:hypothetical protein
VFKSLIYSQLSSFLLKKKNYDFLLSTYTIPVLYRNKFKQKVETQANIYMPTPQKRVTVGTRVKWTFDEESGIGPRLGTRVEIEGEGRESHRSMIPTRPYPSPDSCFQISDIGQTSGYGRQKLDRRYMDLVNSPVASRVSDQTKLLCCSEILLTSLIV